MVRGQLLGTLAASAPVAQGIERAPPEREVAGSIPARRTLFMNSLLLRISAGTGFQVVEPRAPLSTRGQLLARACVPTILS